MGSPQRSSSPPRASPCVQCARMQLFHNEPRVSCLRSASLRDRASGIDTRSPHALPMPPVPQGYSDVPVDLVVKMWPIMRIAQVRGRQAGPAFKASLTMMS